MIKGLYSWHIKQRRFKLFKANCLSKMNPVKKPFSFLSRNHYYFASEDEYLYEKRASRHFLRFCVIGLCILVFSIWFIIECYRGWDVFSL